jgi:hypothetical protein
MTDSGQETAIPVSDKLQDGTIRPVDPPRLHPSPYLASPRRRPWSVDPLLLVSPWLPSV